MKRDIPEDMRIANEGTGTVLITGTQADDMSQGGRHEAKDIITNINADFGM